MNIILISIPSLLGNNVVYSPLCVFDTSEAAAPSLPLSWSYGTTRQATATPIGDPQTLLGMRGVGSPRCGRMYEMNNQWYWVHSSPADSKFTERKLTLAHKHLSQGPRCSGDTRAERKARQMDQEQRSRREIHYEILCLPRARAHAHFLPPPTSAFPVPAPHSTPQLPAPPRDSWLVREEPLFYMSS